MWAYLSRAGGVCRSRTYADAVTQLNKLQLIVPIFVNGKEVPLVERTPYAVIRTRDWFKQAGYESMATFDPLNFIHISGTKGKGSTAAFTSSILVECLSDPKYRAALSLDDTVSTSSAETDDTGPVRPDVRIGLFTSPHLQEVRERIRINGTPVSRDMFAHYFFLVWDRLVKSMANQSAVGALHETDPSYIRVLNIVAFELFRQENIQVAVIECGVGGEYDSTNVINRPAITGVTNLAVDHVHLLGSTIEEIAWHKGGIFKPGVPAFSVRQPAGATPVLDQRAAERSVRDDGAINYVSVHPDIEAGKARLGIDGQFQNLNASLAVAMTARFFADRGVSVDPTGPLPAPFLAGLANTRWPGRCQTETDGIDSRLKWYLDGAHTVESIAVAADWYQSSSQADEPVRILVFNQMRRDVQEMLAILARLSTDSCSSSNPFFSHVFFTSSVPFAADDVRAKRYTDTTERPEWQQIAEPAEVKRRMTDEWKKLTSGLTGQTVESVGSFNEAAEMCRRVASDVGRPVQVLVTGSLHLVGAALDIIDLSRKQD